MSEDIKEFMSAELENSERTVIAKTDCQHCIFKVGDVFQTGCKLDRLNKYKNRELTKLQSNGFYTISTFCNAFRKQSFIEENPNKNPLEEVLKQIEIRIDFIILDFDVDKTNEIIPTIAQCNSQIVKPKKIFILTKRNVNYITLYNEIKQITDIPFVITKLINPALSNEDYIDQTVKRSESTFYTTIIPGNYIPIDFIQELNSIINVDLQKFIMISTQSLHLQTVQNLIHKLLLGNQGFTIKEKINLLATEQNLQHMVINYEHA